MIRIKIRKDLEFELPITWLPTHWIEKQESYLSKMTVQAEKAYFPPWIKKDSQQN